jgi:hypothetical protein
MDSLVGSHLLNSSRVSSSAFLFFPDLSLEVPNWDADGKIGEMEGSHETLTHRLHRNRPNTRTRGSDFDVYLVSRGDMPLVGTMGAGMVAKMKTLLIGCIVIPPAAGAGRK